MKIFGRVSDLGKYIDRKTPEALGFIPTMGALHQGHLSLVRYATRKNKLTICSVFVNPTQFDRQEDLEKYPHDIDKDVSLLEEVGCDLCFIPSVEEIYPQGATRFHFVLDGVEATMEGAHRPGHFDGVATVIQRLFEIVNPTNAYFGEKDFQQLRVIQKLVKLLKIPVNIVALPTVREEDGLAMSSRNLRLTSEFRREAPRLYQTLSEAKTLFARQAFHAIQPQLKRIFSASNLRLEYFIIADEETLQPMKTYDPSKRYRAFIAAFAGNVRLIDNIPLYELP